MAGVYLDGGLEAAREVIKRLIAPEVEKTVRKEHVTNYKNLLQQLAQKATGETPVYKVLDEKGPDHSKCFHIAAVIGQRMFPPAWGPSKKEAEQGAARNAVIELRGEEFLERMEQE